MDMSHLFAGVAFTAISRKNSQQIAFGAEKRRTIVPPLSDKQTMPTFGIQLRTMPPLRLQPLFKQRPWGGRRLAQQWRKPDSNSSGWAESWEVVDLGEEQSRVIGGPFDGRLLHELVCEHPRELLGQHAACGQFPLLFKFLDAAETLSVQVHPNDSQSARFTPGRCGKSEAWVILFAEPDSRMFVGLKSTVDRTTLEQHLATGTVEECLHSITVQPGDVISVPAGTVHAIGGGIAVAEIQQSNDMTFRLFDWNRRDAHGHPRQLHIEQALQCIDFSCGPVSLHPPREIPSVDHRHEVLVQNGHFLWRRHKSIGRKFQLPNEDRCRIVSLIAGQAIVRSATGGESLALGESLLIPADCARLEVEATEGSVLLEALPA